MEAETSTFSSLSSNWVYLVIGALALVLGYFIYKRYFGPKTGGGSVSFASPMSAPAAAQAAPAAPEAEVEEYEEEDDDEKED